MTADKKSIDFKKPVQTKGGIPVTIITTVGRQHHYPVMGYIGDAVEVDYWTDDGEFYTGDVTSGSDLQNIPETKTMYLNIYENLYDTAAHKTKDQAEAYATTRIKARVKVTYEEGQFDE